MPFPDVLYGDSPPKDPVPVSYTHLDVYKRQVQPDALHLLPAYPHPHHDLSVSRGGPVWEPGSHHPLQPPADGGLPERGPERTVKRTGENAG